MKTGLTPCAFAILTMWAGCAVAQTQDADMTPSAEAPQEYIRQARFDEAVEICAKGFEREGQAIDRNRMVNDWDATFKEPYRHNVTWINERYVRIVCSVGVYTLVIEDQRIGATNLKPSKDRVTLLQDAFNALTEDERSQLNNKFDVNLRADDSYGVVQDVQTINRSTQGTNTGTAIGGGVASLAYINRSFSGNNNYSPWAHLGLMILGGLVGSAADKAPVEQYESQYTVKLKDGSTKQLMTSHGSAFVVPTGSCMDLTHEQLADGMCWQTAELIRTKHLGIPPSPPAVEAPANAEAPSKPNLSVADELLKLNDLRRQGVLTRAEFETQKKKLLAQ